MGKFVRWCCWREWFYRVHVVTGLLAALWLLLVALTGVLINHQESLGLLDVEISDQHLPSWYRADLRTGSTRLNILIADLHSGRILGGQGHLVGDLIALLLVISLVSGTVSYFAKRRLQQWNHLKQPPQPRARPSNGKQAHEEMELVANRGNGPCQDPARAEIWETQDRPPVL